jgi:DNA-binding Xre family transcriptional regulator
MLRLNIARLVRQRSRQLPRVYLMAHGFTRDQARALLDPNLKEIKMSTQTKLCELFNCFPSDLYAHVGKEKSHLDALNEVPMVPAEVILKDLSPEEIAELAKMAERMRKGRG